MKKRGIVIAVVAILFLIGVFSITASWNDFFFTTKHYKDPLAAYNAGATYDAIYGETEAKRKIGVFEIDKENALFFGELTKESFLVAEMDMMDGQYAYKGTAIFYDYSDGCDVNAYNQTATNSGYVKWTVVYSQRDIEELSDVRSVKEYVLSNGCSIFLVLFEQ